MARKASLFLVLALAGATAFAQEGLGGMIEGKGWAFLVSAPEGWVLDTATLKRQGIEGLFYKKGTSFVPTQLHMYIDPVAKKPDGPANLGDFVASDRATYMEAAPGTKVLDLSPRTTGMDYSFVLKDFDDLNEGYYQAVAYYEGEDAYFVFVLFCRDSIERDSERGAFLELLDSFTYIRKE
jgi:hypothetical protein